MRRFFISPEKIATDVPMITGSDAGHIVQVLRYKIGDIIGLFDGCGNEYEAKIITLSKNQVGLSITRHLTVKAESAVDITVAQGFLKEKKMDVVVRQLSELGAACWIPFRAGRSVAVPDGKRLFTRKTRWEKIAVEAAKQCGRSRIMSVAPADSFERLIDDYSKFDHRIIFWEESRQSLQTLQHRQRSRPGTRIIIILGPEGGFEPDEIKTARAKGFETFSLGPRILRAETAAVVACSLVQYIFGDIGQ